ncbi:MAG: NTP transferase domain-containing protein [Treponema sp.]|jgi:spore coat polysaccharide biosynthesis protein SpsF|nr:NTP transferase domain-containing protein [Treponema sp.]
MTAVILQARLDSSRLPGKALLPLGGKPLLFRVMEALKTIPAGIHVLASPEDCRREFGKIAEEAGFVFFAGPKDDVLLRYCMAIRRYGVKRVIRATGDNPFVFADAARILNTEAAALKASYSGYAGLPYGAGVESADAESLLRAEAEASLPAEREHVCPYLYNHPELFSLHRPPAPLRWQGPDIRITVDTQADYECAQILHDALSSLPAEERFRGEAVIAAYKRMFPASTNRNESGRC